MTRKAGTGQSAGKRKPAAKPRKAGHPAKGSNGMDDKLRAYVVTRLACYDPVRDIHASLLEMGVDISVQAVSHYNPENVGGPIGKWRDLFDKARSDFLAAMAEEPIANRQYRLRKLDMLFKAHVKRGNLVGAQSVLEQAAKEVGNVYTNVAKVQGAVLPGQVTIDHMTPDEKRNMLADRITEAMAARRPKLLTQH